MMDGTDETAFDAERPRLTAIATRILGSGADADDVVQEAWLRRSRTDDIDDLPAWLTTVVTRLCLDQLRRRRTRSAAELSAPADPVTVDPEADALLADQMRGALEVVLDALAPAERAAFVLHDVFGYPFAEVSAVMGRSDTAVRQLASRARRKVQGAPEPVTDRAARADSRRGRRGVPRRGPRRGHGGPVGAPGAGRHHGRRPGGTGNGHRGGVRRRRGGGRSLQRHPGAVPVTIDGELGAAWIHARAVKAAFVFHVASGRVQEVELIADPDVLATLDVVRLRRR